WDSTQQTLPTLKVAPDFHWARQSALVMNGSFSSHTTEIVATFASEPNKIACGALPSRATKPSRSSDTSTGCSGTLALTVESAAQQVQTTAESIDNLLTNMDARQSSEARPRTNEHASSASPDRHRELVALGEFP